MSEKSLRGRDPGFLKERQHRTHHAHHPGTRRKAAGHGRFWDRVIRIGPLARPSVRFPLPRARFQAGTECPSDQPEDRACCYARERPWQPSAHRPAVDGKRCTSPWPSRGAGLPMASDSGRCLARKGSRNTSQAARPASVRVPLHPCPARQSACQVGLLQGQGQAIRPHRCLAVQSSCRRRSRKAQQLEPLGGQSAGHW